MKTHWGRLFTCVCAFALLTSAGLAALPATLDLANLSPQDRQRILLVYGGNGLTPSGEFLGTGLASYGEINGDAYDDLVILSLRSRVYVLFGSPALRGQSIDLEPGDFETPTPGQLRILGQSISSVAVGDIDSDGTDDILLGADNVPSGGQLGRIHVIYGSPSLSGQFIDLFGSSDVAPYANETRILGGFAGNRIFSGDVNADGFDDIVSYAFNAATPDLPPRDGAIVIAGAPGRRGQSLNLGLSTSMSLALKETRFLGKDPQFATDLGKAAAISDIDRDGRADLMFGAPRYGEIGEAYGFYSRQSGASGFIDLANTTAQVVRGPRAAPTPSPAETATFTGRPWTLGTLPNSSWGAKPKVDFGRSLAPMRVSWSTQQIINKINALFANPAGSLGRVGAFNPDAPPHFVAIGYPLADVLGRLSAGAVLLMDATKGAPGQTTQINPAPPAGGAILYGAKANDQIGRALAFSDLNGDGLDDLIVGASGASPEGHTTGTGQVHVLYTGPQRVDASLDLSAPNAQNVLIRGIGANPQDNFGSSLTGNGDMNGDGVADFAAGAPSGGNPFTPGNDLDEGYVAVVFGEATVSSATAAVYSPPGRTARLGIGGRRAPVVRVWVAYAAGAAPGGGASYTAARIVRSKSLLSGAGLPPLGQTANVFWALVTDRVAFQTCTLWLEYTDAEISGINEADLRLYRAPSTAGPWTPVPTVARDPGRNQVRADVEPSGVFAIGIGPNSTACWELY